MLFLINRNTTSKESETNDVKPLFISAFVFIVAVWVIGFFVPPGWGFYCTETRESNMGYFWIIIQIIFAFCALYRIKKDKLLTVNDRNLKLKYQTEDIVKDEVLTS